MAKVEVDEAQLASAQNVVRTVAEIMKDPKRRTRLLELQKEAIPDVPIPEIDARKPIEEALNGMTKKFEEMQTEMQADREKRTNDVKLAEFQAKYDKGRNFLRARGYNDQPEGIPAIEKLMADRGIADHEVGLVFYERLHPPQVPVISAGLSNFLAHARMDDSDELTKQLIASHGDDNFVLDRMIENIKRESQ